MDDLLPAIRELKPICRIEFDHPRAIVRKGNEHRTGTERSLRVEA